MYLFVMRLLDRARCALARPELRLSLASIKTILILGMTAIAATGHSQPLPTAVVNTPQLHAELIAHAPQGVQAGQRVWIGLELRHQPEWHTYWLNPGDSGLPTQLELNLPAGIESGDMLWPLPKKLKAATLTNYGFDQTALLVVPLTITPKFKPNTTQTLDINLHANWLVCRLECIPQEGDFALRIPTNSSFVPHADAFDTVFKQQPQVPSNATVSSQFDGPHLALKVSGLPASLQGKTLQVFPTTPELIESAAEQHPNSKQSWQDGVWTVQLPLSNLRVTQPKRIDFLLTTDQGPQRQSFTISAPITQPWPDVSKLTNTAPIQPREATNESPLGFVLALIGAFIGGLILNLMPCVLPVLAIKLLGFAQHSRAHRAHRIAGMSYTAGVVFSFLALGAGVLTLRAAGEQLGWGFQLQSPVVVCSLALLFTLIALNLFGLVEVGQILPSRVASFQYKHPVLDAALSGILAVAVASPCTAPFMGASLGLAMTLPTWQALCIFATMGLGLAAPYLLASFIPVVARMLPHPGPWMIALRQLLAFPMLATVVWLIWVLGQQTNLDTAMLVLGGLLLFAALAWSLKQRTPASLGLAWLIAAALAWGLFSLTESLKSSELNALAQPSQIKEETWQPWSQSGVQENLAQNNPVFVDFTAAWCVTCQINKKSTLSNSEVLAELESHRVKLMRADWTRRDPAITAALMALGRSGVPVYVLYAPNQAPLVLSELLSVSKMHEALSTLAPLTTPEANIRN